MAKYQLADLSNGRFGSIYETEALAEAALDALVDELLPTAAEEVLLQEEQEAESQFRDPQVFTEKELAGLAEARIRSFHSIEEVEVDE